MIKGITNLYYQGTFLTRPFPRSTWPPYRQQHGRRFPAYKGIFRKTTYLEELGPK